MNYLKTVYYNRHALDLLKNNLQLDAYREIEESERHVREMTGKSDLNFELANPLIFPKDMIGL